MPRRKQTTAMRLVPLEPGALIFVYLRDSGGAAQERSVTEQRGDVERWCAARGLVVLAWFIDEARASGDLGRREQFAALLDACDVEPPPVVAVIVYDLSRFGRDEYDGPFYRLELRRRGVDVVSVSDKVPEGGFGAIVEVFIDWKNRVFLDDMSRNVRRGLRANVAAGFAPGGTPPTGYKAEQVTAGIKRSGEPRLVSKWVLDEEVAPRVRQAFEMAAAGASYAEIHEKTRLLGSKQSYLSMFKNRSYLGILKFGEEEFPGGLPAIVDQALFDQVQARMVSRAEHAGRARRVTSEYLLSGLVRCAVCGAALVGEADRRGARAGGEGWRYYRCPTRGCPVGRVSAAVLEQYVVDQVLGGVLTVENFERLLAEMRVQMADPAIDVRLGALERSAVTLRRAVSNLLDQVEQGLGGQVTRERLAQREAELATVERQLVVLEQQREVASLGVSALEVRAVVQELRERVTVTDVPVARRALGEIVQVVEVTAGRAVRFTLHGFQTVPPRGFGLKTVKSRGSGRA